MPLITAQGPEAWSRQRGVQLTVPDGTRCVQIMRALKQARPALWSEDIGEP